MGGTDRGNLTGAEYQVLSPWAEADPIALRGISPRLQDLGGKTIGLYSNRKRAAQLALEAFERELLEKMPAAKTSWYKCTGYNTPEMLTHGKDQFAQWVGSVDAVVLSAAD